MEEPRRIAVHGHRGARARCPETTIPAFLHAIRAGADYVELDVLATRDDVLVVCHDAVLKRRRCRGLGRTRIVRELAAAELTGLDCGSRRNRRFRRQVAVPGARIPTLDEVFALAPLGRFGFNIEVKSYPEKPWLAPEPASFARLVVSAIHGRCLRERVVVQSFDLRILRCVRELDPRIPLAALYEFGARPFASVAQAAGAGTIGPYHRLVSAHRVAAAHHAGIRVVPWTANRPRDWARLVRADVDGIITDDPAALVDWLRRRNLR